MPEGDTIYKIACYLAPRLTGRRIRRMHITGSTTGDRLQGRTICDVYARGKHLFFELDSGLLLRSHLGLYGSWHRYCEGEPWRKPSRQASLELSTDQDVFVCFNAKEIELMSPAGVRERTLEMRLGPDLIADDPDPGQIVRRAREFLPADAPLADVLLDQRIASGIGNVYKSEVLFLRHHLPLTPLNTISDTALTACYALAADLLRRNLGGDWRTTRFENDGLGRLWVYGRARLPCLRCHGRIHYARQGRDHRATYWCAGCQS